MTDADVATALGQLVLLLTTIAGFAYQYIREGRIRRWQEEDRRRRDEQRVLDAEDRIRVAADLQRQVEIDAERVLEEHRAARRELAENTMISREAFTQANDVNQKIAAMGERFDQLLIDQESRMRQQQFTDAVNEAPRIRHIEETVEETAELLAEMGQGDAEE